MNQWFRYVSTTIVGILAISSLVAVLLSHRSEVVDGTDDFFLNSAEEKQLVEELSKENAYARPARDTLRLIDKEANITRLSGADAVTTGDNGFISGSTYVWRGLGSATIEGNTTFVPKLIGLRVQNPAGPEAPVFFKLQYISQSGSPVNLGTRKVVGKQIETFVFPAKSRGIQRFYFFYSHADEWVKRQPLEIREVYFAE